MFGLEPSYSAKKALEIFKKNNITNIIELGAGLGRDTIFFAQNGIYVHAIDYSLSATNIIKKRSTVYFRARCVFFVLHKSNVTMS